MRTLAVVLAALALACANSYANVLTFESYSGGHLVDGDSLSSQYPGISFSNATILTAGIGLNELEAPPHSGYNVVINSGGSLSFLLDSPMVFVSAFVTYASPVTMTGYNSANEVVISAVSLFSNNMALSGDMGSAPNEFMSLRFGGGMTRIEFSGTNQSFVIDDLTTSSVPEPSAWLLAGAGLVLVALRRRGGRA